MLEYAVTQAQFAELVGISQQAVSDLTARGILRRGDSAGQWLIAYCANLRGQAAGRASMGDLDLVQERARLAKEQADRVALENQQSRRELAPVALMESTLGMLANKIVGVLESIPVNLRRNTALPAEAIHFVRDEIINARNTIANITLDLEEDEGTEESD